MSEKDVDIRSLYTSEYVGVWDLDGRDVTCTISRVVGGELKNAQKKTDRKAVVYFDGKEKGFVVNKTNLKTIGAMYGYKASGWIGKKITLFASTCEAFGQTVECLRVRPGVPK